MKGKLAIIGYVALVLLPLLLGVGYSLAYSLGIVGALSKGATTMHWERLLADGQTWWSLGYTLWLAVASLVLSLAVALLLAYVLVFGRAWERGLYRWLFLPLAFPPLIAALAILHAISPSGILSRLFYAMGFTTGIADFPRLVNDAGSIGILATHTLLVAPFFALMMTNMAKQEQAVQLRQAAFTLGAGHIAFLRRVFVPLLLYKSRPLIVLYGIFLFGAYEVPLLLGRQHPQVVTHFITEKIARYDLTHIPIGHAMAVLYTVLVGILATWLLKRGSQRG